jgi:hypothetical protein
MERFGFVTSLIGYFVQNFFLVSVLSVSFVKSQPTDLLLSGLI